MSTQLVVKTSPSKTSRNARRRQKQKIKRQQIKTVVVPRAPRRRIKRAKKAEQKISSRMRSLPSNDKIYSTIGRNTKNVYLQQLVDPENAPMVGIPDMYSKLTTIVKPIVNMDMPYLLSDYGNTPKGTFLATFDPYLLYPIHTLTPLPDSLGPTQVDIYWNLGMEYGGLQSDGSPHSRDLQIVDGTYRNMVGLISYRTFPEDHFYMLKASTKDYSPDLTGVFYGVPGIGMGYTNSEYYGNIQISLGRSSTTNESFNLRIVNRTGVLATRTVAGVNGQMQVTFTDPFSGLDGDIGLPGVGFQLNMTDSSIPAGDRVDNMTITAFRIQGHCGASSTEGGHSTVYMEPVGYDDQTTFVEKFSKARFVCAMQQVTFQGSAFNAGKIAALSYEGGQDFGSESLYQYDTIANKRGSYSSDIHNGSYSYWKPSDREDLDFHEATEVMDPEKPFLVVGGIITETGAGVLATGNLRYKQVSQIEAISDSQMFQYNYPPADQAQISQALILIDMLPTSMENPLHLEKIKDFFRGVGQTIVRAGQFVYDHREVILPIAKNLAIAAGMML